MNLRMQVKGGYKAPERGGQLPQWLSSAIRGISHELFPDRGRCERQQSSEISKYAKTPAGQIDQFCCGTDLFRSSLFIPFDCCLFSVLFAVFCGAFVIRRFSLPPFCSYQLQRMPEEGVWYRGVVVETNGPDGVLFCKDFPNNPKMFTLKDRVCYSQLYSLFFQHLELGNAVDIQFIMRRDGTIEDWKSYK